MLLRDDFRAGFAELAPRQLTFEAWCYHPQIPDVTALARAFPDTTIILDHFGGPLGIGPYAGRADEVYAAWRHSIHELATCPNVVAKLGGINMEMNGFGWHERPKPPSSQELMEATRRYYEFTIAEFGADRCMFESNFPVDAVSSRYTVLWNSFKRLTAGYSKHDKARLFHDTAARVYRLD
jgi:predicted TIM-barrel fold metal-dependent hydrolase